MPLLPFAALTTLGAGLWCGVLVALGYFLGETVIATVAQYSHLAGLAAVVLAAVFLVWFLFRRPRAD